MDSVRESEEDITKKYPSVFQGLGNFGQEYEIKLKPGVVPYSLFTPRHISLPLRPRVHQELHHWVSPPPGAPEWW